MSDWTPLITPTEYEKLGFYAQGYATYMQAERPGSRIPKKCPYQEGSVAAKKWTQGEFAAMLEVQDGEN